MQKAVWQQTAFFAIEIGMEHKIVDIYTEIATWFDGVRDRSLYERPFLERAIELAHANTGGTVLDIGCGAGDPIATYFISKGLRVTGVDAAAPMIDMCRQRFPDHVWHVADMRNLDLGSAFDIVLAWHSFFHLTANDQRQMFPIFARHTRKGGVVIFTSGPKAGEAWGVMQGHRVHHASLSPAEYRSLAAAHGFTVSHFTAEDKTCGGATVWTMQKEAEQTP